VRVPLILEVDDERFASYLEAMLARYRDELGLEPETPELWFRGYVAETVENGGLEGLFPSWAATVGMTVSVGQVQS